MKQDCEVESPFCIYYYSPFGKGGVVVAASSIFAKVRIDNPKQAEAFIDALAASENKPKRKPSAPVKPPLTDYDAIRRLMAKGDAAE